MMIFHHQCNIEPNPLQNNYTILTKVFVSGVQRNARWTCHIKQSGTSSAIKIRSIQVGQEQIEPQRLDFGRPQVETRQSSIIPLPPRHDPYLMILIALFLVGLTLACARHWFSIRDVLHVASKRIGSCMNIDFMTRIKFLLPL